MKDMGSCWRGYEFILWQYARRDNAIVNGQSLSSKRYLEKECEKQKDMVRNLQNGTVVTRTSEGEELTQFISRSVSQRKGKKRAGYYRI